MYLNKLHAQVYNLWHLSFKISTWSTVLSKNNISSSKRYVHAVISFRSSVTAQWRFHTVLGREPPTKMLTYKLYKLCDQTGGICNGKSPERWPVNDARVNEVQAAFTQNPTNQPGMLPDKHATHNSAPKYSEMF